jgi:hypothetical protein
VVLVGEGHSELGGDVAAGIGSEIMEMPVPGVVVEDIAAARR